MQTTHAPKPFIAARELTDRESAKALFLRAFDGKQPRDQQRVMHWYGVTGSHPPAWALRADASASRMPPTRFGV
jgi:hypothetical protein